MPIGTMNALMKKKSRLIPLRLTVAALPDACSASNGSSKVGMASQPDIAPLLVSFANSKARIPIKPSTSAR